MNESALLQPDPIRDAVIKLLASYGGIALGVVLLVAGVKALWKAKVEGKEPVIALVFTYLLGVTAKFTFPAVYGENNVQSWLLHVIILLFMAVGAKGIHDGVLNALIKKEGDSK